MNPNKTSWLQRLFTPHPTPEELAQAADREREVADMRARLAAIDKVQATIEFSLDGENWDFWIDDLAFYREPAQAR